jgi:hypothetical protein
MVHCRKKPTEGHLLCRVRVAMREAPAICWRCEDQEITVATFRDWNLWAIVIARTFLATTLLLSAFVGAPRPTLNAEIVFLSELFLGTAIAAGWRIRYVAVLVFLGTVAARLLVPDLRLVLLPAGTGTTSAVLIASGVLLCFGDSTTQVSGALIHENNHSSCQHSHAVPRGAWEEDLIVTIRLEDAHLPIRWKSRCIVTICDRADGVVNTDRESWCAGDRSGT